MPRWQGKSRGTTLGYRIFILLCRKWGATPAYVLLCFVSLYYFLFSWSSSAHIYSYFRKHHHWGVLKSFLNIYRNYYVFGQTLIDKIMVVSGMKHRFTYNNDGIENLEEIVAMKQGGILLSAHVGNWEAAGHLLSRLNAAINVVMYDAEREQIKNYLDQIMGEKYFHVIVIREDMSHVYAIGEALRKNELICLHADRFLEHAKTFEMNFLGSPARFPEGPFAIASTFRVPVSIVFSFKETSSHYHFYGCKYIQRGESESRHEFVKRLGTMFVSELEEKVKLYPTQWFNYYDFWSKDNQ